MKTQIAIDLEQWLKEKNMQKQRFALDELHISPAKLSKCFLPEENEEHRNFTDEEKAFIGEKIYKNRGHYFDMLKSPKASKKSISLSPTEEKILYQINNMTSRNRKLVIKLIKFLSKEL